MEKITILVSTALILALSLTALPAFGADAQVVNINQANAGQLALLPRVGPALAARILEYREANEKFEAAEDLMLVRGIGEKTFELMKPHVVVSGETTLTQKVRTTRTPSEGKPSEGKPSEGKEPKE
jgi:competence protein ComEA